MADEQGRGQVNGIKVPQGVVLLNNVKIRVQRSQAAETGELQICHQVQTLVFFVRYEWAPA